ncbi:MAG: UDP-3-O-(3-hydroxymyristoyl)glucosamine N-acyltransferase [Candidatus Aminicenantes bacterium]|nr:UDP-3-O-(3-hydroxymyristoyl)glucosamine N-acyltransferase [Candidatus Aminicenantes bacterium]
MNIQNSIPRTVNDIAKHLGGSVQGNGDTILKGIMPLKTAGSDHLSFLYRRQYIKDVAISKAGAIIIGKDIKIEDRTLIILDSPREGYRKAMDLFYPDKKPTFLGVSPLAVIDTSAKISKSATIGIGVIIGSGAIIKDRAFVMAGAIIGEDCIIGEDSIIHYGAIIYPGVIIGKRVVIHANAVIGSDGFGFQRSTDGKLLRIKQVGSVVIEDEVEIGACTCVDRATLTETLIGKGSKIDSLVLIGHNVEIGNDVLIIGQTGIAGSAQIGNNSNLYGQVGIRGHVTLGERTTVLARGVVIEDTPPSSVVAGMPAIPASQWRQISVCLKRLPDIVREYRARVKRTTVGNAK